MLAVAKCQFKRKTNVPVAPPVQFLNVMLNEQQGGGPTYVHFGRASSEKNETQAAMIKMSKAVQRNLWEPGFGRWNGWLAAGPTEVGLFLQVGDLGTMS